MRGRQKAVLAALLLLPGLAACEPDQLGAAAIVDDHKITVTQIQGALELIRDAQSRFGVPVESSPLAARNEVHRQVIVLIYDKAAKDLGITITDGELDARVAELRAQAGGEEGYERAQIAFGKTKEIAYDDARLQLIEIKMAEELGRRAGHELAHDEAVALIGERLIATARSMDIRVNPRYGTFDPVRGSIDPYAYDYFKDESAVEADPGEAGGNDPLEIEVTPTPQTPGPGADDADDADDADGSDSTDTDSTGSADTDSTASPTPTPTE